jgi:hypothetical protein
MSFATSNTLVIAFHDGIGELVTPTANFTPATGYPLSNLINSQLMSRTRTPDLTADRTLTWDFGFGTPVTANVFALIGCNATLAATRRWRAADDISLTTNHIQSGASLTSAFDTSFGNIATYAPPWGRIMIYVHSANYTKRFIQWHQTDSTNPDGYQEWGIARVGLAWQPQYGYETFRAVPTKHGPIGSEIILRGLEVTCHNLTRDEAYDLQSLYFTGLSSRRFLIIPEPNLTSTYLHDAIWGTIEGTYVRDPLTSSDPADRRYRVVTTFREVDR